MLKSDIFLLLTIFKTISTKMAIMESMTENMAAPSFLYSNQTLACTVYGFYSNAQYNKLTGEGSFTNRKNADKMSALS